MLRFIFIVLILSCVFRRPRIWGFPFMGGWMRRRPPMGWHRYPPWAASAAAPAAGSNTITQ